MGDLPKLVGFPNNYWVFLLKNASFLRWPLGVSPFKKKPPYGHALTMRHPKRPTGFLAHLVVGKPKTSIDSEADSRTHKALYTPLKFNMEAENQPLEKEIPFGNNHFQVPF